MKCGLTALLGTVLFFAWFPANAMTCKKNSIVKCLTDEMYNRNHYDSSKDHPDPVSRTAWYTNLKSSLNTPIDNLDKKITGSDLLGLTQLTWRYRRSMLVVIPRETKALKERLINVIAVLPLNEQIEWLKELAVLELFSGDTQNALKTINHAKIKQPKDSHVALIHYLLDELAPVLDDIIKETGFNRSNCRSAAQSLSTSISALLSNSHEILQGLLKSLPDQRLRLKCYFLLSELLQSTNECNFQFRFYDYLIYQEIKQIKDEESFLEIANQTIRSYQYFREKQLPNSLH